MPLECVCVNVCVHVYVRQERVQAMELWQTAAQELDHLQQVYQKSNSDGQVHDAHRRQLKVQLSYINMQNYLNY